jgi:chorismate mutase
MTPEEASKLLQNSRKRIDDIDVTLVDLLNRRAGVVEDVAAAKRIRKK